MGHNSTEALIVTEALEDAEEDVSDIEKVEDAPPPPLLESVIDRIRPEAQPAVRGDCLPGGCNDVRPCPWICCEWHLIHEGSDGSGETCALDMADRGGVTLEEVGAVLGLTRERIRQIEQTALRKLFHRRHLHMLER